MKHFIFLIYTVIIFAVFSCKTTAVPIVYDKNLPVIRKELHGINLMIQQGEFDDAAKRLEKALVLYPENKELKTIQCFLFVEQGENQKAKDLVDNLIVQMPENALLYAAKGILAVNNNNFDEAMENFEKSISLSNSRLAFPLFRKGLLCYQQKDYSNAASCFLKAKQIDFRNPDLQFFYFLSQLYITKNLEANIHLWKSVENKANQIPAWYYPFYIQALYDINYKEDSMNLLNESIKKYPTDLHLQLFKCCIRLEDCKKTNAIPDKKLGDEIKQLLLKLPCPETADTWISWLELSNDARLITECRKYTVFYSYSPLVEEWNKKMQKKE